MYRSVVLDMDGVILDFRGENFSWKYDAVREGLGSLGVDPSELSREEMEALLGGMGEQRFRETVAELEVEPRELWNELSDRTSRARVRQIEDGKFSLFPDVREAIAEMSETGARIGVISNAPEEAVEATVEHYGLKRSLKFYRGVTSFEDFHHRKPHPDHLELARAEMKRGPFVYAGDHESDVRAAERADMDSCWVNRNGGSIDREPDLEVSSLKELVEYIQ